MYRCKTRMDSVHIPVEYYHNFKFTDQNMLLFQNNSYITNNRYQVNGNYIVREDDSDILMDKASKLCIIYAYRTLNHHREEEPLDPKEPPVGDRPPMPPMDGIPPMRPEDMTEMDAAEETSNTEEVLDSATTVEA